MAVRSFETNGLLFLKMDLRSYVCCQMQSYLITPVGYKDYVKCALWRLIVLCSKSRERPLNLITLSLTCTLNIVVWAC